MMEIGVLSGDNAKTMIDVAMQNSPAEEVEYYGFDFFSGSNFQRVEQKLGKTGCRVMLFRGDTLDTIPETVKTLPKMDLIFIDGGKSYAEAKSDWENSKTLMHDETAVFIHNYEFQGVRIVVDDIPREEYHVRIISSPYDSDTALIKKGPRSEE
jgi:predicted O-methyltransferase YrrM